MGRGTESKRAVTVGEAQTSARLLLIVAASVIFACAMTFVDAVLGDGDTGWHLAVGRFIWETQQIPATDPFSYTFIGKPWIAHEWLTDVLMYAAYALGGWSGLVVLYALAFAAVGGIFATIISRLLPLLGGAALVFFLLAFLAPMLLARPHVFGWLFLVIWMAALLHARQQGQSPPVWLVPLMLLWANMHGSFVTGILIAGAFGLEALIDTPPSQRVRMAGRWAGFGVMLLGAGSLTPHGPEGLVFPFMVSGMDTLPMIMEWRETTLSQDKSFLAILFLGLFLSLVRPLHLGLIRALILVGLLVMAFAHVRHQAIFGLVALLLLAEPLARAYVGEEGPHPPALCETLRTTWRTYAPLLAVGVASLVGLAGWRMAEPMQRPDSRGFPSAAIAATPKALRNEPVFNDYSFGGALILEGVPVYIDGRADMYGDSWMRDYSAISDGDARKWQAAQQRWGISWTMLPPKLGLARLLDKDPRWIKLYADRQAVIHVRQDVARRLRLGQQAHP